MSWIDGLRHRLGVLLHRRDYDRQIADEQAFHLELQAAHLAREAHGALSAAEAMRASRRRYGNTTIHLEGVRDMSGLGVVETMVQDVRFAWRSFRRTPGFSLVVIATLAIGIGANTAIFSAIDALLLRPLPFAHPDELMSLRITRNAVGEVDATDNAPWSHPKYVVLRDAEATRAVFTDVGLHGDGQVTVRFGDDAERVREETADAGYFHVLRVSPERGRLFGPDEDAVANGPAVAILSHALWTRRFNADPSVVGTTLGIGGVPHTIIGIMPAGFRGLTGAAELWRPAVLVDPSATTQPWSHQYGVIARRRGDVAAAQAALVVEQVGGQIDRAYPDPTTSDARGGAVARDLDATRVDPLVRRSLYILLAAVAMVLLIACANVANLYLVRATARVHELAVRLAVGATRGRLVRQLVTESMLLSLVGGIAGVLLAGVAIESLASLDAARALNVRNLGGIGAVTFATIRLDRSALLVTAALTITCGLVFGVLPALSATRLSLDEQLRHGRLRAARWSWRSWNSRHVLVACEVALAVVLLAGAGLMLQSLRQLVGVAPGFATDNMLTFRLNGREGTPRDSMPSFYNEVIARLAALPSVTGVTVQDCPPLNGGCNGSNVWLRDRPAVRPGTEPEIGVHWIAEGWERVMGVRLLEGRGFMIDDRAGRQKVVLVNATAARRFWPGESALGKPVSVGQGGFHDDTARVVGVVDDLRYRSLDVPPRPDVYLSHRQSPRPRMMFMLRTSGSLDAITPVVRSVMREVAPGLPVYDVRSMQARVDDSTAYARFTTMLLSLFAAVALALAALGTYGVIAFSVSQRTREIGVRMALGARATDVVRLITRQGMLLGAVGAALGTALALASTRVLRAMLYEVSPTDTATFVGILVVLFATVAMASWLPARRAAGIQPTEALKEE